MHLSKTYYLIVKFYNIITLNILLYSTKIVLCICMYNI